jgi:phosphoribosylamine--glycine ligase
LITAQGQIVVEYICRFGEHETHSVLPLLISYLIDILYITAQGKLAELGEIKWKPGASVGVVLASAGYPGPYSKGRRVEGLENFDNSAEVLLFHAGTSFDPEGQVVTAGGRVFNLIALGENIANARQQVYNILDSGSIGFEGIQFRRDIAAREVE